MESPSKTHPKRIGIYGGTFDPIHLGHICLAIEMLEAHHLTEIWFCPAQASPFKKEGASASAQHREAMVRLAIRGIPQLKCSRVDLDRPAPSYTVDTLNLLHQQASKETKFYLILGEDSAETFFCWHQPEEIIKLSQVIIGKRTIQTPLEWSRYPNKELAAELEKGITPTRTIDVSSTEIRQRIRDGRHFEHLLPQAVWRYILFHQLYLSN